MSAPSFSSFNAPPSFSSFPDLEESSSANVAKREIHGSSNEHNTATALQHERAREKRSRKEHESSSSSRLKHRDERDERKERKREKGRHRSKSPRRRGHSPSREGKKSQTKSSRKARDYEKLPESFVKDAKSSSALESNQLFYSDRRGDVLNVQYGGLHTGDIPRYHVVSNSKRVLGLPRSFVIYRRAGKGIEIGISGQRKMSSLTDSTSRALLAQPPTKRLLPSSDVSKYEEQDGFIRLPSRKGPRKPEESYRSITTAKDDSDSSSASEDNEPLSESSDEDSQPTLSAHQQAIATLSQTLTANPTSIPTWIALLRANLSTIPLSSKNAIQARAEVTLSILSRALEAHPSNSQNKVLKILHLKAGEEVWHESKLRAEWEDALKKAKGAEDMDILMEWLEWKIRKGQGGLDAIVDAITRLLNKIGDSVGEDVEIGKLRVFWRATEALRSAGYTERAMAMFQAQAELSFQPPPNILDASFQTKLDSLEEFWDSEVPRTGEENALGWSFWASTQPNNDLQTAPPTSLLPTAPPDLDPYRQWAAQEIIFDTKATMPSRSDAETADPYSMVLFADIRRLLVDIKSSRAKDVFRMIWLSFLGLHVPGFSGSLSGKAMDREDDVGWDDRWNLSHLTRPTRLSSIFPSNESKNALLTDSVAGAIIGREREYSSPFSGLKNWGYGVVDPLDLAGGEPGRVGKSAKGIWGENDMVEVDQAMVRRLFKMLRTGEVNSDENWDVLGLTFELAVSSKSATKASKALLLINQASLVLWGAHAQLERFRGRLDDARKVFQAVLNGSNSTSHPSDGVALLWWNCVETEWLDGKDEQALNVILKSVGIQGAGTGIALLRAKRALEDLIADAQKERTKANERAIVDWVKLRALLELLASEDPKATLNVFDRYAELDGGDTFREALVVSALLMIYYHGSILRKPTPPSILRERAHVAFEIYPSNSIVLGILLETEKGQGVWGRVRSMLGGDVDERSRPKNVMRRAEDVWIARWEKGRWMSEVERTRGGLEAATEHERTKASPVLWRVFIEFEIRVGELKKAKKLLFRAIGECPMVKELYLQAFGPLRSVFVKHELNGLADAMAERGIRLHQGLDEVVESMDGVEDNREGERDELEDEIEYNASELRRLKPY
ncbi:NRDE-2, necessary for RNA interference-domain-containing protein [Crepidotus variabilis]|uniref:NRDE-2, necessary for RNA interference-domain-containing protein n=1 Tax=Crepidotus variabilis TaxID=179855 RepID=A0A9P6JPI2_9AGAR|nr:NRDE-2, necessary for RNA interference-domain-containing protein [Crepidotus variabilis]